MSAMRKAMQYFGFEVADRDDYDYEYADEELAPVTNLHDVSHVREQHDARPRTSTVRQQRPQAVDHADLRRIQTIKPRSYSDARLIGEAFRQGVPVIMNLTEMTDAEAKRLVDFSAGLSFGLHGNIERVTTAVFLLSPAHVEIAVDTEPPARDTGFFSN
ncbi:cell division protein SepF [Demequina sp. TTPB684]|uniref:cell division protein SepF n=1 Tax=unclassified Demequina TaxID=2620311 RepID=UPI001CF382B0|nr:MULTISPECIES: cell division protein SepF [unclassified Demequina]MCB2412134.1 cell division protein SepF [Demequina sp. TTPB684]UPU89560.1 cell division protein SepF [Demequina sp. TMPB413]